MIYYWSALMKHCEALNYEEILALMREKGLLHLVLAHVLRRRKDYAMDFLGVAIEGYSKLCENEDFSADWKSFFTEKEQMREFLKLEEVYKEILAAYPDKKGELRPLGDFFRKLERAAK